MDERYMCLLGVSFTADDMPRPLSYAVPVKSSEVPDFDWGSLFLQSN